MRAIFKTDTEEEAQSEFLTISRANGEKIPVDTPVTLGEWSFDFYELHWESVQQNRANADFLKDSKLASDKVGVFHTARPKSSPIY